MRRSDPAAFLCPGSLRRDSGPLLSRRHGPHRVLCASRRWALIMQHAPRHAGPLHLRRHRRRA
eukprot:4219632-Heterocapsa_arctica.AAC.1